MDAITRVRDLGRRYFDGLLEAAELRELEALLQSDPDAADAFARLSRLEGDLAELFVHEQDIRRESDVLDTLERHERRGRWFTRAAWCAVAASLLFVALGSLWWVLPRPDENPIANEAVVVSGEVRHTEGVAQVMSDVAVVRLSDGSQMKLERNSEYVVPTETRRRVELRQGVGRFTVAHGEEAFRVTTPVGVVTVLGTEFTIAVVSEDDEEEEPMKLSQVVMSVAVLSGLVGVESGPEKVRLSVGESRVFAQEREGGERKEGERKEGARQPAEVRGQRAAVLSVGDNKITVMVAGDAGRVEKTFDVSKDAKVLIDGKPSKLSDLTKGMVVILQRGRKDDSGLIGIVAQGPTFEAKVKSVAKDKITIEGRGREADPVEYPVSKEVKVTIQGKAGKLDELKAGDQIGLGLSADRKTVVAVVKGRGGEREGGEKGGERGKGVAAKVKSIDAKLGTIALTMRGDRELDLSLAKDAKVTIDGKAGKLADIKEGTTGLFEIDRESKTVTAITVGRGGDREGGEKGREGEKGKGRVARVLGKVKGAEKSDSTITLFGGREKPEDRLFPVAKDAKITIDGKPAKLEDIKEDMNAILILGSDNKTVKEITIGPARRRDGEKGNEKKKEGEKKE